MATYRFVNQLSDPDPGETQEWVDSLDDVAERRGLSRARRLLFHVLGRAAELGVDLGGAVALAATRRGSALEPSDRALDHSCEFVERGRDGQPG